MQDLRIKKKEDVILCELSGEIDHHTAKAIRQKIDAEILELRPKTVVLDYNAVSFMDSSGIGLILGRAENCERVDAELIIRGLSGRVGMLIRMSGVGKIKCVRLEA